MGETHAKWTFYKLSKQALLEVLTTAAKCWHLEECAALVSIFVSLSCTSPCTFGLSNTLCTNSQLDYKKALMAVASRWRLQMLKTICKGTGSVSQFIFLHQTCWNPLKHKHKQGDDGLWSITGQTLHKFYVIHFKSWWHAGLFCLCLLTTPAVSAWTQLHLSDGSFPSKGWQNVLWHHFSLPLGQGLLVPVV